MCIRDSFKGPSGLTPWTDAGIAIVKHDDIKVSCICSLVSSLVSLLSSLCPRSRDEAEQGAVWCRKGLVPLWRPHLRTSGGLFGSVFGLLSSERQRAKCPTDVLTITAHRIPTAITTQHRLRTSRNTGALAEVRCDAQQLQIPLMSKYRHRSGCDVRRLAYVPA